MAEEKIYCRHERERSQSHLEETRLGWAMKRSAQERGSKESTWESRDQETKSFAVPKWLAYVGVREAGGRGGKLGCSG